MPKTADLTLCLDSGASDSKGFYCLNNQETQLLIMSSEIRKMLSDTINKQVRTGNPFHNAWVRIDEEDTPIAVGFLAKENYATARFDVPKHVLVIYKILAIVGAIAVSNNLKKIRLSLAVLLPYSEYGNVSDLESHLTYALSSFYFQDKKMSVIFKEIQCIPEGLGLYGLVPSIYGNDWVEGKALSVLMFGERNTSCLSFSDGAFRKAHSSTSDLGFHRLREILNEYRPGLKPELLGKVLPRLAFNECSTSSSLEPIEIDPNSTDLIWLANASGYKKKSDPEIIADAITQAKKECWFLLAEWLDKTFPPSASGLIVSGGASHFWRDNIYQKFKWIKIPRIKWFEELIPYLIEQFNLVGDDELDQQLTAYRLLDVYGYWCDITGRSVLPAKEEVNS